VLKAAKPPLNPVRGGSLLPPFQGCTPQGGLGPRGSRPWLTATALPGLHSARRPGSGSSHRVPRQSGKETSHEPCPRSKGAHGSTGVRTGGCARVGGALPGGDRAGGKTSGSRTRSTIGAESGGNSSSAPLHGLRYNAGDLPGAQTERRGMSRPVRGLLGGKTAPAGFCASHPHPGWLVPDACARFKSGRSCLSFSSCCGGRHRRSG
jgi:hypothetical protein